MRFQYPDFTLFGAPNGDKSASRADLSKRSASKTALLANFEKWSKKRVSSGTRDKALEAVALLKFAILARPHQQTGKCLTCHVEKTKKYF